ncbi:hypothetical protein Hanom_Chr05g00403971 [Helianthus anomalus]
MIYIYLPSTGIPTCEINATSVGGKLLSLLDLFFPPVIQHWVECAYPPAESAYVEGLNNENLMNSTMVDSLKDENYRLESQLQAAILRESRFLSEKNKSGDDLKRVIANLAEEQIIWARDITEKDRVLAHAKNVQEELKRKAVTEPQKERYQVLTVEVETSNAKARAKQAELEDREVQLRKLGQQCDSLISEKNKLAQSSAAHQARLEEVESALE